MRISTLPKFPYRFFGLICSLLFGGVAILYVIAYFQNQDLIEEQANAYSDLIINEIIKPNIDSPSLSFNLRASLSKQKVITKLLVYSNSGTFLGGYNQQDTTRNLMELNKQLKKHKESHFNIVKEVNFSPTDRAYTYIKHTSKFTVKNALFYFSIIIGLCLVIAYILSFTLKRKFISPFIKIINITERMGTGEITKMDKSVHQGNFEHLFQKLRNTDRRLYTFKSDLQELNKEIFKKNKNLIQSENRMRGIIEHSLNGIFTLDVRGTVQFFNPICEELFQWRKEYVIEKNISMLLPNKDDSQYDNSIDEYIMKDSYEVTGVKKDIVCRRKDGSLFNAIISLSHVNLEKETFFTGIIQDVTEQKSVLKKLNLKREQAEKTTLSKTNLLNRISQRLRIPMHTILGMSKLLSDTKLSQNQQDLLAGVQLAGKSLVSIVADTLDVADLENKELTVTPTKTNLLRLLEKSVRSLSFTTRNKELDLFIQYHPSIPLHIMIDPDRLEQVLFPLLSHSIQSAATQLILIHVELFNKKQSLKISISNKEPAALSPEQAPPSIFSESEKHLTTNKLKNTSFSESQKIIKLMGGSLDIEEEENHDFACTIYFNHFQKLLLPHSIHRKEQRLKGLRVLLGPFHLRSANEIKNHITYHGGSVIESHSPQECYDLIKKEKLNGYFHVILLDDDQGGLTSSQYIRDESLSENSHIYIYSHHTSPFNSHDTPPFEEWLQKPLQISILLKRLDFMLHPETINHSQHINNEMAQRYHSNILLVEDNLINQKVTTRLVEKTGCQVEVANHGLEAIKLLENNQYEIIFMDCQMPILDGYQTTHRIRQQERLSGNHQIIIALTSQATSNDKKKCLEVGMDDYISKPVSKRDIWKCLEKWLTQSPH